MIFAALIVEWTQITVVIAVLTTVCGAAVAFLRLFIRTELLTVERRIMKSVSMGYEKQDLARLKTTQITQEILAIKIDIRDVKQDVRKLRESR